MLVSNATLLCAYLGDGMKESPFFNSEVSACVSVMSEVLASLSSVILNGTACSLSYWWGFCSSCRLCFHCPVNSGKLFIVVGGWE